MRRRAFAALLVSVAVAWPRIAPAQPVRRIGILMNGAATGATPQSYVAAFLERLHQLGWTDGHNVHIAIRWNAGDAALAKIYAAQLIGLQPDVVLTASTVNLTVIRQATSTIPVVFIQVSDPVEQRFVASLTKPGGNLTGFSSYEFATGGKWLDLLKSAAPQSPERASCSTLRRRRNQSILCGRLRTRDRLSACRLPRYPFEPRPKLRLQSRASRNSRTVD